MSLYEIDFLAKLVMLLKEAFKFKKYKAMHPVLAVFTGIFMIPLVLASFFATALYAVFAFAFSILSAPVKAMHGTLHIEGQSVKHGTQVVIYFITWPFISFMYALLSILLLMILPIYAFLSVVTYAWSLGGFKFHIFMDRDDDISVEVRGKYGIVIPIVFIGVSAIILTVIPWIHWELHENFVSGGYGIIYPVLYDGYIAAQGVVAFLFSVIGLAPWPKNVAEMRTEEVIEEYI